MIGILDDPEEEGLIPRISRDIITQSLAKKDSRDPLNNDLILDIKIQVSFYEIYNERVYDLLSNHENITPCRVREHPETGAFIEGLTYRTIGSYDAVHLALFEGFRRRITGETLMNANSSRSHAVFTIQVLQSRSSSQSPSNSPKSKKQTDNGTQQNTFVRQSKICLVDLAGSERLDATRTKGMRMKEGTMINLSLSTLGDVIKALSQRHPTSSSNSLKHVPYRNSTLTWVLKDCIGGNSRTTILATISPLAPHYAESLNTLRFVTKAKLIVNKIKINEKREVSNEGNEEMVKEMGQRLQTFEKRISQLENIIRKNGLSTEMTDVDDEDEKIGWNERDEEPEEPTDRIEVNSGEEDEKEGTDTDNINSSVSDDDDGFSHLLSRDDMVVQVYPLSIIHF